MAATRASYAAVQLQSGRVLVAGGVGGSGTVASAEIFDPATGTWTATAPMNGLRAAHTATVLPSGKVVVAGGSAGGAGLATAEIFDPQASGGVGSWSGTGSLGTGRSGARAVLLPSGSILMVGGSDGFGTALNSVELFDPDGNAGLGSWASTASARSSPAAS
jgi:N-acetylneuraminic acid mutarotase